ncbi:MAG: ABC transporter ATP-binding protein [Halobacteriales archaeon]
MSDEPFLRMEAIVKEFPGVVANDHVDFSVRRGEIHGLLGENGAGKSTLMNVLYGLYRPDGGEVYLDGQRLDLESPQDAIRHGIGMVHQHFMLIPRLTVAENVVLGRREPAASFREGADRRWPDWIARNPAGKMMGRLFTLGLDQPRERIADLAAQYGFEVDVDARIWELDVGQQQRVEILKALYRDVDLLILDEPTAVLTPNEAERLFETLEQLAEDGLTIIFITHKLKEVTAITDRVTVLRNGEKVETVETSAVTREDLARLMVGRDVLFELEKDDLEAGPVRMAADGLRATDDRGIEALSGIDLEIHEGEIVGIAGVSGNGQRELAETLVGIRQPTAGTITVGETDLTGASARDFIENGVSFVPEDRYRFGCAQELSVMHNAVMKDYRRSEFGDRLLDYDAMRTYAEELVESFDIRGVNDVAEMRAGDLSGGNLQKLILARELSRDPDVLIANQPTRGVDVGAIEFVRKTILEQRSEGTGVLLISEDLDEIFDLSDRILVIYEGEFVHEASPESTTPEEVGLEMTGGRGLQSETSSGPAVTEAAGSDAP